MKLNVRPAQSLLQSLLLALALVAPGAFAQTFPDHPLKLVVPFPPGGATDVLGRILAKRMGEILGQPFIVENKGGAGGTIGTDFAAHQPADGYTMLLVNAIPHTASRKLYPDLRYDPVKSFTPVGSIGTVRYILAINNDVPAKDYAQFVQLARSEPGKLNFGTAGIGTAPHLAMELFMRAAQIQMLHVPYQGTGPAMTDLLGGRIQAIMENVPLIPNIRAGKIRALAITGVRRSAALPDVPTFGEVGLPGYDVTGTWGLIAPAGVPERVVAIVNDALVKAVADPAVRDTLTAQGIEPAPGSAADYGAVLARESDKWSRLIDEAKIKL